MAPLVSIEIDVFSGQPNPRIELHGQQARHLMTLLKQKRERLNDYRSKADLGLRGFLVRLEPASMETYRVVGDTLVKGVDAFHDPHREVQDYIVSVLPRAIRELVKPFIGTGQSSR
jgi:hypothetical protein